MRYVYHVTTYDMSDPDFSPIGEPLIEELWSGAIARKQRILRQARARGEDYIDVQIKRFYTQTAYQLRVSLHGKADPIVYTGLFEDEVLPESDRLKVRHPDLDYINIYAWQPDGWVFVQSIIPITEESHGDA